MDQLVATLGPASFDGFNDLVAAGACALRLNASHMTPEEIKRWARAIRASQALPIVVDLQGAKMRLGLFPPRDVHASEVVEFGLLPEEEPRIPLPHAELFKSVDVGETLACDDDRIRFRVLKVDSERLVCECLTDGRLQPRKGVNIAEHPVELRDLSEIDAQHVRALEGVENVMFAFSFMLDGWEADWLRRRAPHARVVGKVERKDAIDHLDEIADRVDEIWICRGDLGAHLGDAELARWVSSLDPREFPKPVLMAGQVFQHLVDKPWPTRSEVCHLNDLIERGYAGVVLSDETAIGKSPIQTTAMVASLITSMQTRG